MLDPYNVASLGLSIRLESITCFRFSLAGDLFAFIIRFTGRAYRESMKLAVALKNHEGSFATRLTVLVYWRQVRLQ
jgi:hypothetical protein